MEAPTAPPTTRPAVRIANVFDPAFSVWVVEDVEAQRRMRACCWLRPTLQPEVGLRSRAANLMIAVVTEYRQDNINPSVWDIVGNLVSIVEGDLM
jgi:hypothetical protein